MSRSTARFVARLLIGVLVFAQMAVAAYACTATSAASGGGHSGATVALRQALDAAAPGVGSADAMPIDADQPALCVGHCRSSHQQVEIKPLPTPPMALTAALYNLEPVIEEIEPLATLSMVDRPPPQAEPPHTILHCCWRI